MDKNNNLTRSDLNFITDHLKPLQKPFESNPKKPFNYIFKSKTYKKINKLNATNNDPLNSRPRTIKSKDRLSRNVSFSSNNYKHYLPSNIVHHTDHQHSEYPKSPGDKCPQDWRSSARKCAKNLFLNIEPMTSELDPWTDRDLLASICM